ncbi:MAG: AEC family transporter, partial [Sedimentisphaerales bacterium]|nr:AEC family transporter [Sedimentisphaerales bacterium]
RRSIISQSQIQSLTAVTVNIFLPCMIFAKILKSFDPSSLRIWWVLPLSALLLTGLGLLLGLGLFPRTWRLKKNMLALASMQNAGYLVLPVGAVVYADQFDRFALYVFLFIPGLSPLLWSFGKYLTSSKSGEPLRWQNLITPPLVANLAALLLVFCHLAPYFTQGQHPVGNTLFRAVDLLGEATVPLATFILGSILGSISIQLRPYLLDAGRVIFIKLIALPALVLLLLYYTRWAAPYPILGDFLILEAAAPPAASLILLTRIYGGDLKKVSSLMLITYLISAISLPFWLALWLSLP